MHDISILLPCGFSAKYKDIFFIKDKFPCPVCKSHGIIKQECLEMTRNKMLINEFNLEQKKNNFKECLKNIEVCKSDPKGLIDESYENLKNQLDIRREQIKLIMNKKINDYYEDLLKIIEEQKETKLNEFDTRIQQIPSLEQEIMDLKISNTPSGITKKLDTIDSYCAKIENGINFLNKIKNDLTLNNWIFNPGDESLDIKRLFGELDWKEETEGNKTKDHINKMDDVSIILPCGFFAIYKDILSKSDTFPCPACKTHDITRQECLKMARNRLVLIEKSFEFKKKHLNELLTEFECYKKEPKIFIDESYDSFKREIYLRRKNLKDLLNKTIDVYHDRLLKKIDMERDLNLNELKERIQQTETLDFSALIIDKNLDNDSKFDFYKRNSKKVQNSISLVRNICDVLAKPKYKITDFCDDVDFEKFGEIFFGELYLKEETIFILNEEEIDENAMDEATIQLVINNFSILNNFKNYYLASKTCIIQNLEFSINITLNQEDECMGFFLDCNSLGDTNEFFIKVNAVLSLLNKSDSKKDFNRTLTFLFTKHIKQGYSFATMNEILNPKNGYYDANDDSITLKAVVKAELTRQKQWK